MAWLLKSLPHKHKDLSLDLHQVLRKPHEAACTCNPTGLKRKQIDTHVSLASKPNQKFSCLGDIKRPYHKKTMFLVPEKWHSKLAFALCTSVCDIHTGMHAHAHTHTHTQSLLSRNVTISSENVWWRKTVAIQKSGRPPLKRACCGMGVKEDGKLARWWCFLSPPHTALRLSTQP